MAQKRRAKGKTTTRRKQTQKNKGGFNIGKFTLGMFILIALGYGALAIWEGKLVPDEFSEFEFPEFLEDEDDNPQKPDRIESDEKDDDKPLHKPGSGEGSLAPKYRTSDFDAESFDLYFTKAFDFGWPDYNANEAVIERPYYTIRYNELHEQAMWVAYKLNADSLNQEKFERKDDFRKDPRVRSGSAELKDYKGSGYDRGHLAPAAAFSYDEFALSQSFYMSNMSPQAPSFNRGVWKKLEEQVRDWAAENGEIYVVTGPILTNGLKSIGPNKVSVPDYYYKIVLDIDKPEIKAVAFLMKNEGSTAALESFVVPIDRIEQLTELDFFPSMPDDLEAYLESGSTSKIWVY